jgi:hypothetical protein
VLSKAVEWGVTNEHPMRLVRRAKTDTLGRVRYLSSEEEARLRAARTTRDEARREGRRRFNAWRAARGYETLPEPDERFSDHLTPIVVLALNTGLYGVRGVWLMPNGGYLLATHEGSQVLYVDASGIIHVFVDGALGNVHDGDGDYFHSPGLKVSEVRAVSMDSRGNILITENDYGYVRMISFLRLTP